MTYPKGENIQFALLHTQNEAYSLVSEQERKNIFPPSLIDQSKFNSESGLAWVSYQKGRFECI